MLISSRTPEGEANQCPVCRAVICIEPSQPTGDAPCPHCGSLLWFSAAQMQYFSQVDVQPSKEARMQLLKKLEIDPNSSTPFTQDVGADSLDIVELVMALEEEFGTTIPAEDLQNLKTVEEVIDYLRRCVSCASS